MMENQEQQIPTKRHYDILSTHNRRAMYHETMKRCKHRITEKLFSSIIEKFHERVVDKILNENLVFKMPHLGFRIKIVKLKRNVLDKNGKLIPFMFPVDWKATREMWQEKPETKEQKKLIYYMNDHTDGYIYRIKMFHGRAIYQNSIYYRFRANRNFQRALGKILKDPYNKKDYYEL